MRKVVFLLTSYNHAGAENQVVQLARGFRKKGWHILIISMIKPTAPVEELNELDIGFQHLDMRRGVPDPRAIYKLKHLLEQFKPHIVHSHLVHANILARLTRLFVRIPVLISTAHSNNEGGWLRTLMYRLTDSLCELTTNVSQDAVNRYIQIKAAPKSKIRFIPNGINADSFYKSDKETAAIRRELVLNNEFIWLAVGRLTEAKDYPNLLTAFSQVVKENSNCVLLIVGEGPQRGEIEEMARTLHVGNKVHFLGIRKDIRRLMNAADAYVMSSLWEGMPMVLLEASACKLPVVSTDVGGNREVIRDGISGYLVEPAKPVLLAAKMKAMMSISTTERETMGARGREYVLRNYNIASVIDRWESIYTEYLNNHDILPVFEEGFSGK